MFFVFPFCFYVSVFFSFLFLYHYSYFFLFLPAYLVAVITLNSGTIQSWTSLRSKITSFVLFKTKTKTKKQKKGETNKKVFLWLTKFFFPENILKWVCIVKCCWEETDRMFNIAPKNNFFLVPQVRAHAIKTKYIYNIYIYIILEATSPSWVVRLKLFA